MRNEKNNDPSTDKSKDADFLILLQQNRRFERKINNLTIEKQILESEKRRKDRELKNLRSELDRMKQTPLILGQILKILEDDKYVVHVSSGLIYIVSASPRIKKEELKIGRDICLNQRSYSIIEVLPQIYGTEIDVKDINRENDVQFNNIDDFKRVVRAYNIPFTFKKGDERKAYSIFTNLTFTYKSD